MEYLLFVQWCPLQLNDPGLKFTVSERAEHLELYLDMNPSDETRINIKHNFKFENKELHKKKEELANSPPAYMNK